MLREFKPLDITRELYAAVSGPAGPRDWSTVGRLFHPDARLVRTGVDETGAPFQIALTWEQYTANVDRMLAQTDFHEEEIEQRSVRYGFVAEIRSLYRFRMEGPKQARSGRGLNLFNLVQFPDGWKIMSLVWDNERPGLPPPTLT